MATGFVQRFKGKIQAANITLGSLGDRMDLQALTATISPAASTANVCLVTITFKDANGTAVAFPVNFDLWLSDAATGVYPTAVTASGAVTTGASGVIMFTYLAKFALRCQSTAAGVYILSITDTAKTGFYVCVQTPGNGKPVVSAQLVTANYG